MIEIDGSKGGGQMLRTALTLSAITQKDFKMKNIRGNRSGPGLKKQHNSCIEAVERITNAEVKGNNENSRKITFKPKELKPGKFTVNIGTAGSTNLVCDTLLPLATVLEDLGVTVKGGTDVEWSPTSLHFAKVKNQLLNNIGLNTKYECGKTGFYPKGQGKVRLEFAKTAKPRFNETERGELKKVRIYSKASKDLEVPSVAERQAQSLEKQLKKNISPSLEIEKGSWYVDSASTGSVLAAAFDYENCIAGFDNVGEQGKRSEKVARELFAEFAKFQETEAVIDPYLGDQLMVFAALLGWSFTVPEMNNHVRTNKEVVNSFLENGLVIEKSEDVLKIKGKEVRV